MKTPEKRKYSEILAKREAGKARVPAFSKDKDEFKAPQALGIVTDLMARKFYGKLTISFEKGKVVTWNVSENFKP